MTDLVFGGIYPLYRSCGPMKIIFVRVAPWCHDENAYMLDADVLDLNKPVI